MSKTLRFLHSMYYVLRALPFIGRRYECPICGWKFRRFLSAGIIRRRNARCPRCSSLERHRLVWLYLQRETDFLSGPKRFLHIAPEFCFTRVMRKMPHVDYVSVDRDSDLADYRMDIMDLRLESETFDCLLCMHVLEHVADDYRALCEMQRILKQGAWAIIAVPIDRARESTFEDPRATSGEARLKLFGQTDHVRIFGKDVAQRIERTGFEVTRVEYADRLSYLDRDKYGITGGEEFYYCKKNSS